MSVVLTMMWQPRGDSMRLQKHLEKLRQLYDEICITMAAPVKTTETDRQSKLAYSDQYTILAGLAAQKLSMDRPTGSEKF